jgi:hypothetical protein
MIISNDMIFIIVIGLITLAIFCTCNNEGKKELYEGFDANIADVDISAIRNLSNIATQLMKPDGTITNPGNLKVSGNIIAGPAQTSTANGTVKGTVISSMGNKQWGMLWGDSFALIGSKGAPMRFGFADDQNANGWVEYARLDPDSTFRTNHLSVNNNVNIGPDNKFVLQPGGDSWLRLYDNSGKSHGDRGFAATNLWTQKIIGSPQIDNATVNGTLTVNGRNILAELDALNKNTIQNGRHVILQINGDHNRYLSEQDGRATVPGFRGEAWSRWIIHKRD